MGDPEQPMHSQLSLRVRTLRLMRGWSISDLAKESGIEKSVISRLEAGKQRTVHPHNIEKLAHTFGVGVDEVTRMGFVFDPESPELELLEVEPEPRLPDNPFVRQILILAEQLAEMDDEMLRKQVLVMLKQRVDLEVQRTTERLQV